MASAHDMDPNAQFDFWYAVHNTEVIQMPRRHLQTFGTTRLQYYLITEPMDSVGQVRVREGSMEAAQPQILTPQHLGKLPIQGFDDQEAARYLEWMREHANHLRFLQYGFQISKQDVKSYLLHEELEQVQENVCSSVRAKQDDFSAVVRGVDQPWEVCLLKLMVDMVESSMGEHVAELQRRHLLPNPQGPAEEIEAEFTMAARDPGRVSYLYKRLNQLGLFSRYEDRFFALVKSTGQG